MKTATAIYFDQVLRGIDLAALSSVPASLFAAENSIIPASAIQHELEAWAGISLQQIQALLQLAYAQKALKASKGKLSEGIWSSTGIQFSRMEHIVDKVNYYFYATPYGDVLMASSTAGICYLAFYRSSEEKALTGLQSMFPEAVFHRQPDAFQQQALNNISNGTDAAVSLHVAGNSQQWAIWEQLVKVPYGALVSYGELARATGYTAQEIGVAMGDNRIALLLPCHRVIKSTGELGQYHWGARRKQAILLREAAKKMTGAW